jgi:5,5'-dehydrodivanillate O-demethylase
MRHPCADANNLAAPFWVLCEGSLKPKETFMSDIMTKETRVRSRPPQEFYDAFYQTGPETLGGKYQRLFWHPIAVSDDLAPGRAKPIKLLSEQFTLYRGETGTLHLTEFQCPHRRTQLSVGYVEGDAIRCLYHGWKFGADGACVERPAEPGSHSHVRIKTYGVAEFLGLIFAYIGDGPAPSFPPMPGFEGEGLVVTEEEYFECNHFQSWENDWDLYHADWTHKQGEIHGPAAGAGRHNFYMTMLRSSVYEETDFGVVRTLEVPGGMTNASVLLMPSMVRLFIPTFNELNRRGAGPQFRDTYIIHVAHDDYTHSAFLTQLVPVVGEEAETYKKHHAEFKKIRATTTPTAQAGREILAGRSTLSDYRQHPVFVAVEDTSAQCGQGVIVDRHKEMLGTSDAGVIYLRRLMARELTLLEEGKQTKDWKTEWKMPGSKNPFS